MTPGIMKHHQTQPLTPPSKPGLLSRISSIGTKIILPYLLLTLLVSGTGAFIVVRLVTGSLQERFSNQLLDAGRVVSESMVDMERDRLAILRVVTKTEGVPEALLAEDREDLADRVPQIIANSNTDAVGLLDNQGRQIYGWQRPPNEPGEEGKEQFGDDFSHLPEVRRVLNGYVDELGEKRIFLNQTPYGLMMFTIGPIYLGDRRVGAAMVGSYLSEMVTRLTESASARVTLYDQEGNVMETSLGGGQEGVVQLLQESPEQYQQVISDLRESPNQYFVVAASAEDEVPFNRIQVLGQEYSLAYGDWRVRSQSLGLFSVALPNNFIVTAAATSRNLLSLLFAGATVCVFVIGFVIAQRITGPLKRLVQTSIAVSHGDLDQRTGIRRNDEIGSLASSFDTMTERLAERNRQLVEQASKLEAILNSTADGIVVLNQQGLILTANPAARAILTDTSDFLADIIRDLPEHSTLISDNPETNEALKLAERQRPRRYKIGTQVFSALIAPMKTPDGEELGSVVALRDVTREAESEQLKDSFITSISHELRTPLTSIKGYTDLLLMTRDNFDENQSKFVKTISRNVEKLNRHIHQIIEISEIQDGTLKLNKQEFCFSGLVQEVADRWRERIEEKGLALTIGLPDENLCVRGDSKRLSWAISNLLSNAYNYTSPDGQGQITVTLFREADRVRLDVADTGIGIAVADQAYLFTRFFRASHQMTFDVDGVGLGLFISRAIIKMHGGRIWAKSKLNVGSTFSLALPLLEPDPKS